MKTNENFFIYKTLFLTRKNPKEMSPERKKHFKRFYFHDNELMKGDIVLGEKYKVKVFYINEPENLKFEDYLSFLDFHKENLIGAQVACVDWTTKEESKNKKRFFNFKQRKDFLQYQKDEDDLWVDTIKTCLYPLMDGILDFEYYLGCINPDFDGENFLFCFYSFEKGTENMYLSPKS